MDTMNVLHTRVCIICNTHLINRRADAKTCSDRCRKRLSRLNIEHKYNEEH